MITKTMLTLGMTLSLMSPLASYARMGTETSGGGDAVIVNDQMVMRDLLDQEQVKKVEDNLKFLNETPGFRKLIYTLAKINPAFASSVLEDLLSTQNYLSPSELQLLPYSQTTVSGKAADVQFAIRTEDDIVFAPSFFKSKQQEYVLLHESLHGILSNNSGPMHHLRVRNIVKYINENINNLDAKELRTVLANNNYYRAFDEERESRLAYQWDEKLDDNLRCFFIANDGGQEIEKFENLNCLKDNYNEGISASLNLQEFMKKKFPEYAGEALEDWNEVKSGPFYYQDLVLKKDSLFDGNQKRWQKMLCRNNNSTLDDLNEYKKNWSSTLDSIKKVNSVLSDASLGNAEKVAFLYAQRLRTYSTKIDPIEYQAKIEQNLVKAELGIATALKQKNACDKQYPKNY